MLITWLLCSVVVLRNDFGQPLGADLIEPRTTYAACSSRKVDSGREGPPCAAMTV
jgi:hypothetical protein